MHPNDAICCVQLMLPFQIKMSQIAIKEYIFAEKLLPIKLVFSITFLLRSDSFECIMKSFQSHNSYFSSILMNS
jgi:hypothetical protein